MNLPPLRPVVGASCLGSISGGLMMLGQMIPQVPHTVRVGLLLLSCLGTAVGLVALARLRREQSNGLNGQKHFSTQATDVDLPTSRHSEQALRIEMVRRGLKGSSVVRKDKTE